MDGSGRLVCHDGSNDSPTDILTVKEIRQKGFALTRAFVSLWPSDHENIQPETLDVVVVGVCAHVVCSHELLHRRISTSSSLWYAEDRVKVLRCRMAKTGRPIKIDPKTSRTISCVEKYILLNTHRSNIILLNVLNWKPMILPNINY